MTNPIHLIVRDRKGTILDTKVSYVSSFNERGRFDVLSDHANFISIVDKRIIYSDGEKQNEIDVTNGIMRVAGNTVEVYLSFKGLSDVLK